MRFTARKKCVQSDTDWSEEKKRVEVRHTYTLFLILSKNGRDGENNSETKHFDALKMRNTVKINSISIQHTVCVCHTHAHGFKQCDRPTTQIQTQISDMLQFQCVFASVPVSLCNTVCVAL